MMLMPTAKAHTPAWQMPTFAYIAVAPNPVGVGQSVSIYIWLNQVFDQAAITNDYRFHNYELTITEPNGATTSMSWPTVSDPTSNQLTHYTPTQTGTYKLTFTFPGQAINAYAHATLVPISFFGGPLVPDQFVNDTYLPSSASTTLTVQSTPLPPPVGSSPMPTQYWTRPIFGENTAWWSISSNWLGTGAPGYSSNVGPGEEFYHPDAVGPLTAHIMWTKPLQSGGVAGGNSFVIQGDTYMEGSAYVQRYVNPIILDGMLYYTEPVGETGVSAGPTDCVNLQTGQLIWSKTTVPALSFGYLYDMQTPDYHGVWPPIIVASVAGGWQGYDGDTGDYLFTVTNIPTAGFFPFFPGYPPGAVVSPEVMGPEGETLMYVAVNDGTPIHPQWYLGEWNSSQLGTWGIMATGVLSGTINGGAASVYTWNVSIPWANTMNPMAPFTIAAASQNMLLCYNGTLPASPSAFATASWTPYTYFAVNLNPSKGAIGSVLWWNTVTPPAGNITVISGGADFQSGVFLETYRETLQWVGYNLNTGAYLWGPTPAQQELDYYGSTGSGYLAGQTADGLLYSSGYGGIVYCYNDTTGKLVWTYGNGGEGNSTNAGFQNAYGDYPTFVNDISNGVVYTITTAHTVESPIYKGALTRALNATTGQEIYTLLSYTTEFSGTSFAVADGYANFFNGYDNQIYVIGRGPSDTTVTAPNAALSSGQPVVLRGTVMDVSAGTKQTEQAADFPNGVPCASDASMSQWMSYVYQQQPEPTNFTGVQVTVSVLDSNGNHYSIGTVTTDSSGMYTLTWTPIIAGNYTVYANFAGTNGYWPSSDTSSFNVMPAGPTAPPTAPPVTGLASTSSLELGIAAVIIVIIIIGVVLAVLTMRKHA